MPARTTPFQMTVHFLREHWAGEGTTVTESKMLQDSRLNILREVDVTVEGQVDGEPVLISFEVIEHGRPASITWVEQIVGKHRHLPTNRLVLVSKSGFSKNAMTAVKAEGGWVAAVTPEVVETDSGPEFRKLFLGTIRLRLLRGELEMIATSDHDQHQLVEGSVVESADGDRLGTVTQLAQETLALPWVGSHLLQTVYDHPERHKVSHFTLGIVVAPLKLSVRISDDIKRMIVKVHVVGTIEFAIEPLTLAVASLDGRRFVSGTTTMLGRETLWVGTDAPDDGGTTMSFRTLDSEPVSPDEAPRVEALAAHLAKLQPPTEWMSPDDESTDHDSATTEPGSA